MISLRSKVVRKLLSFLYLHPGQEYYTYDLCRNLGLDKRNLVKKLHELESENLLISRQVGNVKLYRLNTDYALHDEYRRIISATIGLEARLREIVSNSNGIEKAFIFGSYAADSMDAHSDIDLLVVGDHSVKKLQKQLVQLQQETGRDINPVSMDAAEYRKRVDAADSFLTNILERKHIRLI